jgi:hypothetical protein
MPDEPADRHRPHSGEDAAEDPSILDDILGVVPRLIDRTSAQLQFSQTLLSMLPCTRRLVSGPRIDDGEVPAHEARQPTDVLSLLDEDDEESQGAAGRRGESDPLAPSAAMASGESSNGSAFGTDGEPPSVEDLAIPDYDSLAASQVVPRLTTLEPEELEAVGAYEAANRSRRTILNRVTALLSR